MAGGGSGGKAAQDFWDASGTNKGKVWFYLFCLILAYFAKYFCTSFLYVVQKLWLKDPLQNGTISIPQKLLAYQFILGYCMSMIGKRAAGNWADKWGGKNVQMLSLGVYIPVVILWSFGDRICNAMGLSSPFTTWLVFLSMWLCNGFFALGLSWVAIMVCASNWIPKSRKGLLLAVVGCAPELGDASARAYLGPVIKHGWSGVSILGFGAAGHWPTVSLSAALASILMSLPMFLFVNESPPGHAEEKKKEQDKKKKEQQGLDATLMTLTCTMCGLLYAIRTMFLLYSVTWLSEVYCTYYHPTEDFNTCDQDSITVGNVASASLLFTFFGMFSVMLSGQTKDLIPWQYRGYILLANSIVLVITVSFMLAYDTSLHFWTAAFLVGMIGFGDFGPYKTMSGVFAVEIGGESRKGDVTAWMGVASNGSAAIILIVNGFIPNWVAMFKILLALACGCIACSLLIVQYDQNKLKETQARESDMEKPFLALE